MNPYIFSTDELLEIFSPSTLASLVQDIDNLDKGAGAKQVSLRNLAEQALIANVGETEADGMIADDGKPDEEETETFVCHLCGKTQTGTMDDLTADWTPGYWVGKELSVDESVCPECTAARLTFHEADGEFILTGTAAYEPQTN